jgi:DNA modification methylase
MTYKIVRKIKKSAQEQTSSRRKELEADVALDDIAASAGSDLLRGMRLRRVKINSLKTAKRRVRKTAVAQLAMVMHSIVHHKQCVPIIFNRTGEIINGHIVVEALEKLGSSEVWGVEIDDISEEGAALLHVTLNHLGETGEWDIGELGSLLIDLDELGLDLSVTGFNLPELDIMMHGAELARDSGDNVDEVPAVQAEVVSVLGDLWQLGEHELLCGDSTQAESYERVLGAEKVCAIFTDCPWNIPIKGFVSSKHKDFKMGVGEMTPEQFAGFVDQFTRLCADRLKPGAAFLSCIDWRSVYLIIEAGEKAKLTLINMAVWNKGGGGGMGSYLRSAHELIPIFCNGAKLAVNNVELGKHGRNRSNVWSYPGANRKGSSAQKAHASHPTPKSVEMVEDALMDVTLPGGIVLDPFLGSGTTLIAAERIKRKARCIELDPAYVDVAIRRWETLTGKEAVHAESQLTFREVAAERSLGEAA